MKRFGLRLRTLMLIIAILALLLVVVIQQVQIGRMRQLIDAGLKEKAQLTKEKARLADMLRDLQDRLLIFSR
jgi:hypothetical protein